MHENRAECLFSFLKPYLWVFRGVSKLNLPGYVGFFQFLRNVRHLSACEQAELILQAALGDFRERYYYARVSMLR